MRKILIGQLTAGAENVGMMFYEQNNQEKSDDPKNPEGAKYRKTEMGAIKLSYTANGDEATHPVYDPSAEVSKEVTSEIKFNQKKRHAKDAFTLREHIIEKKTNVRTVQRLAGTMRLKQNNVDTTRIMKEYKRKAQVSTLNSE